MFSWWFDSVRTECMPYIITQGNILQGICAVSVLALFFDMFFSIQQSNDSVSKRATTVLVQLYRCTYLEGLVTLLKSFLPEVYSERKEFSPCWEQILSCFSKPTFKRNLMCKKAIRKWSYKRNLSCYWCSKSPRPTHFPLRLALWLKLSADDTLKYIFPKIRHSMQIYYENTPIQKYWKFHHQKWKFSDKKIWYFSYFCSKYRLWVLVRTALERVPTIYVVKQK